MALEVDKWLFSNFRLQFDKIDADFFILISFFY